MDDEGGWMFVSFDTDYCWRRLVDGHVDVKGAPIVEDAA